MAWRRSQEELERQKLMSLVRQIPEGSSRSVFVENETYTFFRSKKQFSVQNGSGPLTLSEQGFVYDKRGYRGPLFSEQPTRQLTDAYRQARAQLAANDL